MSPPRMGRTARLLNVVGDGLVRTTIMIWPLWLITTEAIEPVQAGLTAGGQAVEDLAVDATVWQTASLVEAAKKTPVG